MAAPPPYSAARSGPLGDPGAVDASAGVNQLLAAHPSIEVYTGSEILTPSGTGGTPLSLNLGSNDWTQPFTMSGTAIGRVVVPVAPVGNGADLVVSLFTDSSGSPGTLIASTRIAAKALLALVATATLAAGSAQPLETATSNALTAGPGQLVTYAAPAVSVQGGGASAGVVTSGNNILLVGGADVSNNPVTNVFGIAFTGGTTLAAPVPQPSLPQAVSNPGVAATPDTLVVAGGVVAGVGAPPTASVFTASLNPQSGVVGAWSTQTSLPQALSYVAVAASGENIYVIGGLNNAGNPVNTVYWATVQNGQITAWQNGPTFPTKANFISAAVVNGFLVAADNTAGVNVIRYAPIAADGSLGSWQTGPTVPYLSNDIITAVPDVGLAMLDYHAPPLVNYTETLTIGPNGPAAAVQVQPNGIPSGTGIASMTCVFPTGSGTWQLFSLYSTKYFTQALTLVPSVSVALPASGLTNGSTYHVVLSQQGGDAADYLLAGTDQSVFPGNPTAKSRARSGGSGWTAAAAGTAIPIQLWDRSTTGNQVLHTWVDNGAQHGTLVYATTPDRRLLGVIDQTAQPGPVLNATPTFTGGTAPWTATGGAIGTSSAHVHGSLPLSGTLTPTGSAATSQIESEQQPVFQGHSHTATAWVYSQAGYASVVVNINWYNSVGTLLSTTTGATTSVPAATWTQITTSGPVPASATAATVVVAETGTPPGSAVLFVSAATLQDASGPMLPSVAQIQYASNWPGAIWPPTGVAQLV